MLHRYTADLRPIFLHTLDRQQSRAARVRQLPIGGNGSHNKWQPIWLVWIWKNYQMLWIIWYPFYIFAQNCKVKFKSPNKHEQGFGSIHTQRKKLSRTQCWRNLVRKEWCSLHNWKSITETSMWTPNECHYTWPDSRDKCSRLWDTCPMLRSRKETNFIINWGWKGEIWN